MKIPFKLPCLMDSSAGNPRKLLGLHRFPRKLPGLAGFPTFDQALCMGGPESWRECPGHIQRCFLEDFHGMIIGIFL